MRLEFEDACPRGRPTRGNRPFCFLAFWILIIVKVRRNAAFGINFYIFCLVSSKFVIYLPYAVYRAALGWCINFFHALQIPRKYEARHHCIKNLTWNPTLEIRGSFNLYTYLASAHIFITWMLHACMPKFTLETTRAKLYEMIGASDKGTILDKNLKPMCKQECLKWLFSKFLPKLLHHAVTRMAFQRSKNISLFCAPPYIYVPSWRRGLKSFRWCFPSGKHCQNEKGTTKKTTNLTVR
jgi:hypothetical protein